MDTSQRPLKAVVFDVDDTLYPERQYVLSGFRAVAGWGAARLGLDAERSYGELAAMFESGVRGDTFDRWLRGHEAPPELVAELVAVYRDHVPTLALEGDVSALLAALRPGYRVGVVTDGHAAVQRAKCAALRLEPLVDAIVYSDDLGREHWKPSPRPYLEACDRLRVSPGEAVYVADNPAKDFLGARRAGMSSIRVTHLRGEHWRAAPRAPEYAPDLTVDSIAELRRVLLDAADAI